MSSPRAGSSTSCRHGGSGWKPSSHPTSRPTAGSSGLSTVDAMAACRGTFDSGDTRQRLRFTAFCVSSTAIGHLRRQRTRCSTSSGWRCSRCGIDHRPGTASNAWPVASSITSAIQALLPTRFNPRTSRRTSTSACVDIASAKDTNRRSPAHGDARTPILFMSCCESPGVAGHHHHRRPPPHANGSATTFVRDVVAG
jgi:hypothetical protein